MAAHPSIAAHAGNRAVQRLVDPVQRDGKDGEQQAAASSTPAVSATQMSHPNAGDVPAPAQQIDGRAEQEQRLAVLEASLRSADDSDTAANVMPALAAAADATRDGSAGQDAERTGPSHAVEVTDHKGFRDFTTAVDVARVADKGFGAVNGIWSALRLWDLYSGSTPTGNAEAAGYANIVPGIGLTLNVLAALESAYRGQRAFDAATAMDEAAAANGADGPGPHASAIIAQAAPEQRAAGERHWWNVAFTSCQAILTTIAMAVGVTSGPGGWLLIGSAGVAGVGAWKNWETWKALFQKYCQGGKAHAKANAEVLVRDAVSGNRTTIALLEKLGISEASLGDADAWADLASRISDLMPLEPVKAPEDSAAIAPQTSADSGGAAAADAVVPDSGTTQLGPHPSPVGDDAALRPSAVASNGSDAASGTTIVRRSRGPASAAIAAAVANRYGTPLAATTPHITPDGTPMSESLKVVDVEGDDSASGSARARALSTSSADDEMGAADQAPMPQQIAAHRVLNATSTIGDGQTSAALQSPDRSPMSENLQVEDYNGEQQPSTPLAANGFVFGPTDYM